MTNPAADPWLALLLLTTFGGSLFLRVLWPNVVSRFANIELAARIAVFMFVASKLVAR